MPTVGTARIAELDELLRVEQSAWIPSQQFSRENSLSQFAVFPEGMLVARNGDDIAGMFILNRLDYYTMKDKSWYALSDDGNLRSAFRPDGRELYGISLTVSPEYRRQGIGGLLVRSAVALAERMGAERFLVGSRIPEYHLHRDTPIAEYVSSMQDRQLRFYASCGLEVIEPLPGYFEDGESLDYGVLMGAATSAA